MKKRYMLLLGCILFATVLSAQEKPQGPPKPPTSEERLKKVTETLNKELQLSAKQQQVVANAYKNFFAEVDKLRPQKPAPPPPPEKEKVEPLAKKRDQVIQAVLSADTYRKYLEVEKKLRPPHPPRSHQADKQ